jgi:REP element-mobilizing transposase RayT
MREMRVVAFFAHCAACIKRASICCILHCALRGFGVASGYDLRRIKAMAEIKQRKNLRLHNFDYSSYGMYFITICAKNAERIFSEVNNNSVILSQIGKLIEETMLNIPKFYKNVNLDCYVIMPNHIHIILGINFNPEAKKVSISNIINQFKGYVTKQIGYSLWHTHFHEYIIRDHNEYVKIADYIKNNPAKWREDRYFDSVVNG